MSLAWINPVEQAMVLIDVCGDVDAAHELAATNCEHANSERQVKYWFRVAQALVPPEAGA